MRQAAELGLGSVRARLSSQVVVPGDTLEVEIRISPKRTTKVNGASVELRAQEVSVSGTGKDRATDRYQLFSKVTPIPISSSLGPGSLTTFRASTSIPDKGLYSFVVEGNALVWEAVVRVDVPFWPDWEKAFPLLVWPAEALLEEGAHDEEGPGVVDGPEPLDEPEDRFLQPAPPAAEATPNLTESVQAIREEGIFGGNRDRLIKSLIGLSVTFDLRVARVERTFAIFSDTAYRNGRTLTGSIPGTGEEVRVWCPEAQNGVIDSLELGSIHPVSGTVTSFDRLSLRPTIRADASQEMEPEQE
jgi:hypothetical protein